MMESQRRSLVHADGEISFPLNPHKALAHAFVTRNQRNSVSEGDNSQPSNPTFKRYVYGAGTNQPYMEK